MTLTTAGLNGDYALTWDSFVGQSKAKAALIKAAKSARMRSTRMPHTLLASGTPGIGKTNLALLAATEHGGRLTVASGKLTADRARALFVRMRDGDILFVDEIHTIVQGGKGSSEWLLNFMIDGVLLGPRGPEEQPNITIMGATTEAGRLGDPLLQRFVCRPPLEAYSDAEAAQIALRRSERIFVDGMPPLPVENATEIAQAAANAPREIGKILENIRDTCLVECAANWDGERYDVGMALEELGLTPDGLTADARRYLAILLEHNGDPVGQGALQDRMREPGGLEFTERLLVDKGYLFLTKRGRMLTSTGLRRAVDLEDV